MQMDIQRWLFSEQRCDALPLARTHWYSFTRIHWQNTKLARQLASELDVYQHLANHAMSLTRF